MKINGGHCLHHERVTSLVSSEKRVEQRQQARVKDRMLSLTFWSHSSVKNATNDLSSSCTYILRSRRLKDFQTGYFDDVYIYNLCRSFLIFSFFFFSFNRVEFHAIFMQFRKAMVDRNLKKNRVAKKCCHGK